MLPKTIIGVLTPSGLSGGVGMVRNWTFTVFYCAAELFGDVCLGLLFWGLANDITSLENAPMLYPLFGIGANIAQALAGLVLKVRAESSWCLLMMHLVLCGAARWCWRCCQVVLVVLPGVVCHT